MKDYYAILGVSSSATESEIKKAFRRLAVRYHPDKNPSEDAKGHFQEINEAYDVLGDHTKRAAYDLRRSNPLADLFSQSPTQGHPDPAYRRKRARPPRPKGPPASYIIMRDSLPYMLWISKVAIVVSVLFFLDYLLPYRQSDDHIQQIYSMRSGSSPLSYVILTGSGEELRVHEFNPEDFERSRDIRLERSLIYGSVMTISNPAKTYTEWVAYMYTTHIFFPILLLLNSLLAVVNRKRVEFCFNLNVTAFVLLIINLTLI